MLSQPSLFKTLGALRRLQEETFRFRARKVSFANELILSEAEIDTLFESISRARSARSSMNFNRPAPNIVANARLRAQITEDMHQ